MLSGCNKAGLLIVNCSTIGCGVGCGCGCCGCGGSSAGWNWGSTSTLDSSYVKNNA